MWEDENAGTTRLIDKFDVRYAPSAVVEAAAVSRANKFATAEPYLVALADPTLDLPATRPEVTEITERFEGRAMVAVGTSASWTFLRANADRATHLHLACHGQGGLFPDSETLLWLSDGPVSVPQLTEIQLWARVASVSACQTALSGMTRAPDELLSISTAMLGIGAACCLASLWPVDDAATALLMIRTYEEMLAKSLRPPEALRQAQLWLQAASLQEVWGFLAEHPRLNAEFQRRAATAPITRQAPSSAHSDEPPRPFAHPYYWAGFVATGA
jgi:CHAT domain-containing protein